MAQSPIYQPQIRLGQEPQGRTVPPLLAELTPEQWGLWLRHPVTALLLDRYLPDLRHDIEVEVVYAWANMRMTPEYENQMRAVLAGAQFVEGLSLAKVRGFYGLEPER